MIQVLLASPMPQTVNCANPLCSLRFQATELPPQQICREKETTVLSKLRLPVTELSGSENQPGSPTKPRKESRREANSCFVLLRVASWKKSESFTRFPVSPWAWCWGKSFPPLPASACRTRSLAANDSPKACNTDGRRADRPCLDAAEWSVPDC